MKCSNPVEIKNPKPQGPKYILVPCGKCADCKQDRLNKWSFRLEVEYRSHAYASFVTLTYNDESLPFVTDDGEFGRGLDFAHRQYEDCHEVLCKSDLQKFFRRLRKAGYSIGYYAIGEYGSHTNRPHYHALIYSDDLDFTKVDLSLFWSYGFVKCGSVCEHSIKYVCKHHLAPKNEGFFWLSNLRSEVTVSDLASSRLPLWRFLQHIGKLGYIRRMVSPWAFPGIISQS